MNPVFAGPVPPPADVPVLVGKTGSRLFYKLLDMAWTNRAHAPQGVANGLEQPASGGEEC
jgi:hypothetical protein